MADPTGPEVQVMLDAIGPALEKELRDLHEKSNENARVNGWPAQEMSLVRYVQFYQRHGPRPYLVRALLRALKAHRRAKEDAPLHPPGWRVVTLGEPPKPSEGVAEEAPTKAPEEYKDNTPRPGRPTARERLLKELERRHDAGEMVKGNLAAEARDLSRWLKDTHKITMQPVSIANALRKDYRRLERTEGSPQPH
jgi:hypothetical protein